MRFTEFWRAIKIQKWGKYVLTLLLFAVVYLFVGEQSIVQFVRRGREIRQLEEQRDLYRSETEKASRELETLSHPDSLERYAREHYYMHNANEDIFLIDDL